MAKSTFGYLQFRTARDGSQLAYWYVRLTDLDGHKIKLPISRGNKPNRQLEEREFKNFQRAENKIQFLINLGYKDQLIKKRILAADSADVSNCPTLKDFAPQYLEWAIGRTLSGQGIKRAKLTLGMLVEHLGQYPLMAITPNIIDTFVNTRKTSISQYGRPFSPKTINNDLTQLSSVMRCALRMGLLEKHPFINDQRPLTSYFLKTIKKMPVVLTPEEIDAMFRACGNAPYRQAVFLFLLLTSVRQSEATDLEMNTIDLTREVITFNVRKTDNYRPVKIGPELKMLLAHMMNYWPDRYRWVPRKPEQMKYLFCNREGGQIVKGVGFKMIRELAAKAGITKHVTPHALRHSSSAYLRSYMTLFQLSKHLGHSNATTTEKYGYTLDTGMSEVAAKLGPAMGLQLQNLTFLEGKKPTVKGSKGTPAGSLVAHPGNLSKTAPETLTGKRSLVEVVGIENATSSTLNDLIALNFPSVYTQRGWFQHLEQLTAISRNITERNA